MKDKRWTPLLKGRVFCSPACGANCTKAEFDKANRLAKQLIERCEKEVGGKWEARVWENLGWHYSVNIKGGGIAIYPSYSGKYLVALRQGGTPSQVHVGTHSKSIKWLVKKQLSLLKSEADLWNKYLSTNKKLIG